MPTYTYDDGSTLTDAGGTISSTPAPAGYMLSDYGSNFTPSAVNPQATSWMDVLKYGIGRVADYQTTAVVAQNQPAYYANRPAGLQSVQVPGSFGGINLGTILIAGLAFFLVKSLAGGKKG